MEAGLPSGDINAKYKKLATEYSKLKVHVKVLKKGVLDEQSKSAELRSLLREKDKDFRKNELEIDSLNFRNQQLTKRVTVLLDDLQNLQLKHSKKHKGKPEDKQGSVGQSLSADNGVLQEELQKKILENANYASELTDRIVEISQLKSLLQDSERQLAETESRYKCEIAKLKNKNQEVTYKLEEFLKDKESLTPNKANPGSSSVHNGGDFMSEAGSMIGSEDALSSVDMSEHACLKAVNTEPELEKLKMEYDLLKIENDELRLENSKYSSSNEKRTKSESHDSGDFNFSWTTVDSDGKVVGLLGNMDVPFVLAEEVLAREDNIKKYFRKNITELNVEKQMLESKVDFLMRECETLRSRYDEAEKMKEETENTLLNKHNTISRLEDELQSTARNYEQQITILSEHMAHLNDTIAGQHDELQRVKHEKSKKK